jgi:endonuclease YncB( thermonuclease family)
MMRTSHLASVFLGAALLAAAPSTPGHGALPWIEDDYGRALAEAKSKKLPIFVDAWAPW